MKRSSNITAWQLRLFEGFDRDVMVMQRDEEEVFDEAIHVFFEKDYYDTYLAKAQKYSTHRYAYHEDKLGEVINQIFDENIPGLVLHMETQEKGLCEEKYLDQKALFGLRDAADSYHHMFMASIERMPKEQAVARLWTKTVYIIGTLPDPTKPANEPQKVEIMTMRRKADGSQATMEDYDHESIKVFLTAESAMRFNPDKKPVSKTKLAVLGVNVRNSYQIIIEPHRNYFLEFDPAKTNLAEYLNIPKWTEETVKERAKEFASLEECYVLLAYQVSDYRMGISAPFLLKFNENTIILNLFEKYEDAVQYCLDNPMLLPIRDGVFPIGKVDNKEEIHSLKALVCLANLLGVTNISLDTDTVKGIGMKIPFFMEAAGIETQLDAVLSEEDCNRMSTQQDGKTLYRFPIYSFVDNENEYEVTSARKNIIIEHLKNDKDKALAFISTCSTSEIIFALSEIGRMLEEVKKGEDENLKKEYNIWLNMVTVILTEALLEKPFIYTLRNDDNTFTQKNGFSYLITTDRFENIRTSEGKLTLASVDNENFMQKFVESTNIAIVTDGPNALAIADARIILEVSKQKKTTESLKEEILIYLTQGLNLSFAEANNAYKKLHTDNSLFVEFVSTIRNNAYPPMGMVSINGWTAGMLAESKKLNFLEAYEALLDMKINPKESDRKDAVDNAIKLVNEKTSAAKETDDIVEETTTEKKSIFGKLFKK